MKKAIVHRDLNGLSRIGLDHYAQAVLGLPNVHWQVLQNVARHDSMPLMNIGDMIEFLDEKLGQDKWVEKLFGLENNLMPQPGYKEWVRRRPDHFKYGTEQNNSYPNELADALWELVKEVLNHE